MVLCESDFDHYKCPSLFCLLDQLERSGRAELVKDSLIPWPLLNTCGQRKIWFINEDLLD